MASFLPARIHHVLARPARFRHSRQALGQTPNGMGAFERGDKLYKLELAQSWPENLPEIIIRRRARSCLRAMDLVGQSPGRLPIASERAIKRSNDQTIKRALRMTAEIAPGQSGPTEEVAQDWSQYRNGLVSRSARERNLWPSFSIGTCFHGAVFAAIELSGAASELQQQFALLAKGTNSEHLQPADASPHCIKAPLACSSPRQRQRQRRARRTQRIALSSDRLIAPNWPPSTKPGEE